MSKQTKLFNMLNQLAWTLSFFPKLNFFFVRWCNLIMRHDISTAQLKQGDEALAFVRILLPFLSLMTPRAFGQICKEWKAKCLYGLVLRPSNKTGSAFQNRKHKVACVNQSEDHQQQCTGALLQRLQSKMNSVRRHQQAAHTSVLSNAGRQLIVCSQFLRNYCTRQ